MVTIKDIKTKIQNLIDASNTATNQSNTDLTSAVDALLRGYGTSDEQSIHSRIDGTITEIESYATQVYVYAFASCANLTTAIFPNAKSVAGSAFSSCRSLVNVYFPKVETVYASAFSQCSKLESIILPEATSLKINAFSGCYGLKSIDLPKMTNIANGVFSSCYSLASIIIRNESMCSLENIGAFNSCYHILGVVNSTYNPDGLKDGYFYVPSSLVESYKQASNWSNFATQFRALEDYTVDGTITGELDPNKI